MENLILFDYSKEKKSIDYYCKNNNNFNNGDILKATVIEKKDNTIFLETSCNTKFKTSINNISVNIGDILNFKVIKNKNNIALKFINKLNCHCENINSKNISNKDIMSLFKQSNFVKENSKKNCFVSENDNIKKSIAVSKLQNKLKYIKNNINLAAVNELLSNGISFESIDLDTLNCFLQEVKSKDFNIQKKDNNYFPLNKKDFNKNNILNELKLNKMPITDTNINYINKSLETFESVKNIKEDSIVNILNNNNKEFINLKDLYISKYSSNDLQGYFKKDDNIYLSNVSLNEKIKDFLFKENIETSEENINISKFLVENEIPITKNNIYTTKFLKNIENYIDTSYILEKSIYNLKTNKNCDDINLYNKNYNITSKDLENNYINILNNLQKISLKEIIFLEKNKIPVNLFNLQKNLDNNITFTIDDISNNTKKYNLELAEIQLKLTSEASYRLINKNIKIDTLPLKKVVEELRILEKDYYKNILEYKNVETNENNINKMYNTFSKIPYFKNIPHNIYNKILNDDFFLSINNINKSFSYNKTLENYDLFATYPNKKYGDSLKNLNDKLKVFLENLNIEANENNIKSANILFKNNIDINYENILKVNNINNKLNNIKEKFHPIIAANMIKEGINPLNIHIDKILEYIASFKENCGDNLNNKLYKNILNLNKLDNISEKEKDSIISIYKMINYIEKNGSAALGTNIISGHEFTLGNLLDASKYYNKTKGIITFKDIKIDDNFQKEIIINNKNIKKLLNESSSNNYKINKENNKNLLDVPINDLLGELGEIDNNFKPNIKNDNNISHIKNILSQDIKTLYFMERNNIPLTSYNIDIINNLKNNKNYIEDNLNYILEKSNNKKLISKLLKNNTWENYLKDISKDLDDIILSNNDFSIIDKISLLQSAVKIKNNICKKQKNYSIPIKVKNKITSLNMFIKNKDLPTKNNIEIGIYINIPSFCEVKGYILKDNKDIYIKEDCSNSSIFKNNKEKLKNLLKLYDFNLKDIISYKEETDFDIFKDNKENSIAESNKKDLTFEDIKKDIFDISSIIKEFLNNL